MSNKNQSQCQPLETTKQSGTKSQPSKQKSTTGQPPAKKDKRTLSDVSNESTTIPDMSVIQTQLDDIAIDLGQLKDSLNSVLKKDDIEALITSTITNIMSQMENRLKKDIERQVEIKTKDLQDRIGFLEYENKQLADKLHDVQQDSMKMIEEVEERQRETERRSKEANRRANYNEQYSRKNNIKITNVTEEKEENSEKLTEKVNKILGKQDLKLETHEIVAIHRIPSKKNTIKPILIKTLNNDIKSRVMRKRKELKEDGHRIFDDVTMLNTGLINRLQKHPDINSAWFFNGAVYGETVEKERIKFDLYDNITDVIATYRR